MRDTASPRANLWGGLLAEQTATVLLPRTNSPGRDPEPSLVPSLSEAAYAFAKEGVDGEAVAVVAPAEPPTSSLDGDDLALWDIILPIDETPETSTASVRPDPKDMLVTPAGFKKASVQFNKESEQVRN